MRGAGGDGKIARRERDAATAAIVERGQATRDRGGGGRQVDERARGGWDRQQRPDHGALGDFLVPRGQGVFDRFLGGKIRQASCGDMVSRFEVQHDEKT